MFRSAGKPKINDRDKERGKKSNFLIALVDFMAIAKTLTARIIIKTITVTEMRIRIVGRFRPSPISVSLELPSREIAPANVKSGTEASREIESGTVTLLSKIFSPTVKLR
jgi:hypothetical protein